MFSWISALATVIVAGVFGWAGAFKAFSASTPATARRSALRELTGERWAPPVLRGVGVLELVLATLLLLPAAAPVNALLVAAWSLALLGYLTYARVHVPESSCGCLSAKTSPVGPRHFARTGLLLAGAVTAVATGAWPTALAAHPALTVAGLVVGTTLVAVLSPDLDHLWLVPLRRARIARRHPLGATVNAGLPAAATMDRLRRSDAFRELSAVLRSDMLEQWDEDGWRIVTFAARSGTRRATAVFAMPLADHEPHEVRVVLVEDPESAELAAGVPAG